MVREKAPARITVTRASLCAKGERSCVLGVGMPEPEALEMKTGVAHRPLKTNDKMKSRVITVP